jgi:hypothetical protein
MKPTTDEVLKWAMESGMDDGVSDLSYPLSMFEKFSALAYAAGAAAMKERAAKVCEDETMGTNVALVGVGFAEAIRALGDDDD